MQDLTGPFDLQLALVSRYIFGARRQRSFRRNPFGGGPRLFIGNNFALMEATLIVAMTMQRYRLDLMTGQTVKVNPKGTLRPRPGVWMTQRSIATI